jgi:tRNA (cytidine/uridine-2'-O-)-methyltransferase
MFEIVLVEPEIPPNTGNVMRLCANSGCRLHLVRPFGFALSDRHLQRAGLDYRSLVDLVVHEDWQACHAALAARRWFAMTTHGTQRHDEVRYRAGDAFVFGPETRGLSAEVRAQSHGQIRLPMRAASRSLNLSNAVAVAVYEAWRQLDFNGAADCGS